MVQDGRPRPQSVKQSVATFRFDNTVETKLCEISLNMNCMTTGADENNYMRKPQFRADLSLYKSFLKDKLSLSLYVSDLFKNGQNRHYDVLRSYARGHISCPGDARCQTLPCRYKFNTSRSKYKGTGAGAGQKSRL